MATAPPRPPLWRRLPGPQRLLLLLAVVWLGVWAFAYGALDGVPRLRAFVLVGAAPVVLGWGLLWVVAGFVSSRR